MSVCDSDSGLSICSSLAPGIIKLDIRVPDLDLKKLICINHNETVTFIKKGIIDSLSGKLRDAMNYGLFLPGTSGKAGKFLQEERPIKDYGLNPDYAIIELRYKKRLFKSITVNISKLKKLHTRTNLKNFHDSVASNDIQKVLKMLNKGLDPNYQMKDTGETPLIKACTLRRPVDMIKTLVEGGAHLDYRHSNGHTPLHIAAIVGNIEAVKTLLDLGQSPNTLDQDGLTPLYHSVMSDHSASCTERLLFDYSVIGIEDDSGLQEIHQACRFGRVQHLEYLLQYGADINCQTSQNGNTPLHICAYLNQENCVRLLLFRGADRSLANRSGHTPYQQAMFSNNLGIAQLIQEYRSEDVVPVRVNPQYNDKRRSSAMSLQSIRRSRSAGRLNDVNLLSNQNQQTEDSGSNSIVSGNGRSRENSCRVQTTNGGISLGKQSGKQFSQSMRQKSSKSLSRSSSNLNDSFREPGSENAFFGNWWPDWDQDENSSSNSDADESVSAVSTTTNSTATIGHSHGPMHRRSARSKTKDVKTNARSQSAKRRGSKPDMFPDLSEIDANYLPRMVVLQRTSQGFGFVIRGMKASSAVDFSPSKKHPALQYFEDVEPNSVASRAGIKRGDFILEINNQNVVKASHEDTVQLIKASGDILALKVVTVPQTTSSKSKTESKQKSNDFTLRSFSHRVHTKSVSNSQQDSSMATDCSDISSCISEAPINPVLTSSKQRPLLKIPKENVDQHQSSPDPPPPPLDQLMLVSKRPGPPSDYSRPPSIISMDSIYPLPPPPTSESATSPKFDAIVEEEVITIPPPNMPTNQPPPTPPSTIPIPTPPKNIPPPPPPTNKPPPAPGPPPPPPPPPPSSSKAINIGSSIEKPQLKPITPTPQTPISTNRVNNPVLEFDSHLRMAIAKRRQKMDCDQISMTSVESSATVASILRKKAPVPLPSLNDHKEEPAEQNSFQRLLSEARRKSGQLDNNTSSNNNNNNNNNKLYLI